MSLASDALSDLYYMLADWGDSVTIAGVPYSCIYEREYVEMVDVSGFLPTVTGKTSELAAGSSYGTAVTVTSEINGITNKAFVVRVNQDMGDGTSKLVLEEA